ncbi:PREDICTED: sodium-coupled monocarboxylate transporter 2-like [Dufourea novaeangliae]|uniref:sodium-coupled monocarboxylate transporter 2-like n=1 Tax=Dufourea novaeangliae TaxID=178035 RepID=UPI000766EC87|nr:PREDICTED: sodium-coupled monocarboxylate transporter 2-like [Dufourea novaeangliae]
MAESNGSAQRSFDLIDSAVFAGMLGISAIVGVYQAYKSRKNADAVREYLVGGQNMSIFPISMSLIASYISGIAILGLPAEMYVYGTQFWCVVIADSFVSLTMAIIYLPVFYGLGITSSYEYLKLRFNDAVRLMGSVIFLIKMLLYIPLVIYVPALAFNQVTGINLHAIALLVCAVCIFYTTLGGLKAVVWTDAIQTIVMFGGVIVVAVLGTNRVGGIDRVWERNRATGRIEFFDMSPDPTTRHTFWSVVVGNYLNWLATCSVNQSMVQRCLAMPNLKKANATIAIMAIGIMSIVSLSCYTGIVVFAAFYDCDPVITKQINKPDQLLPFFVMQMADSIPGLPGLFVAGVFSAALSTMSTGLNSMSGVIYEDMIKPCLRDPISEVAASRIMKIMVVVIGTVCVAFVFLVEKLGGLIQVESSSSYPFHAIIPLVFRINRIMSKPFPTIHLFFPFLSQAGKSLSGITAGPLLGMFTLGMFFPVANSAGALVGGLVSLNLVAWISFGTQAAISSGEIAFPVKPVSVDGCPESLKNRAINFTVILETAIKEQPFILYRISYLWYTWVGFLTAILVGLLVSWITGVNKRKPGDEKLYTPIIHGFLRSKVAAVSNRQDTTELGKLGTDTSIH